MRGTTITTTRFVVATMLAAAPFLGGCASQSTIDELRRANAGLNQRVVELDQDNTSLEQTNAMLRQRLDAESSARSTSARDLERLQREMRDLTGRLQDYRDIILPADLDEALRDLAERYPDFMTYDPQRGMVQFASDLTFASGSDQVQESAMQTLARLAEVLKSESAAAFEVRVVGHTDTVPIGKPETRAKHPTNVHLSVHRAISVRKALLDQGVEPHRMSVAGWGEFYPVVQNQPRTGAEENRRVEIFIVPLTPSPVPPPSSIQMGQQQPGAGDNQADVPVTNEPLK